MSIDFKRVLEISATIVVLVGAGASGSWYLYKDKVQFYKDEVKSYKESDKLNYPELLKNISSSSESLQKRLDILNDYDVLKKEVQTLKHSNLKLSEDIEISTSGFMEDINDLKSNLSTQKEMYKTQISKLEQEVAEFKSNVTQFQLMRGNGTSLKSGLVQVGYSQTDAYYRCNVTVNGDTHNLEAGASVDVMVADRKCKVILNTCPRSPYDPSAFELICR